MSEGIRSDADLRPAIFAAGVPADDAAAFSAPVNPRRDRRILILAGLAAFGLIVIGVRFFFWPELAQRFFGFRSRPFGFQLHTVVAMRDLWLGIVALGMVWLREWRLLTLWLAAGALVCFGDAGLIVQARGRPGSIVFHLMSGLFMTTLALLSWRRARRDQTRRDQVRSTISMRTGDGA